jgi:hypothetical protein
MPRVHSRVSRSPPFGPKLPNFGRVPPLPFFPTTAVYSTRHPAGLLHPASDHGVRHVSGLSLLLARRLRAGADLPQWRYTLRSFPLPGRPSCVTARRFPHVVVPGFQSWIRPCCHVWVRVLPPFARLQGFAPPRNPLPLVGVAAAKLPDAPLGLVPAGFFDTALPRSRPPLRGVADGRSLCGPKTARGPPVGSGRFVALPEGRPGRRPVVDLIRSLDPEGFWFRLRPSAG